MASERCWRDIALLRDIYSRFTFVLDGYSPRLIPFSDPKYVHPLPRPAEHLSKEKSEEIDGERKALAKPCHTTRYTLTFSSFLDTQSPRLTQFFDQKKETKVYLSLGQGGKSEKMDGERKAPAKYRCTTRYKLTFSSFLDTRSPRLTQFFDRKKNETKVSITGSRRKSEKIDGKRKALAKYG